MRVTHVIWSLEPRDGGPPAALVGLGSAQRAIGMQVNVVATFRKRVGASDPGAGEVETSYTKALRAAGAKVTLVGPVQGPLQRHSHLQAVLQSAIRDSDVVHIHGVWEEVNHLAARVAGAARVPYIVRPCGMLDPWSLAQGKWKKRLYVAWRLRGDLNGAAALHFTTDSERDLTAPLHLRPSSIVEPNGVAWKEFAELPSHGEFRSQHPSVGDKPLLLFLSRLHAKKGLDILLPAFAQLRDTEAKLVIAGPDEDGYAARLAFLIEELGLTGRVLLVGPLYGRDRIAALVDADMFVLPSHQENFGIAVVEALAAGTPVIVSDQVALYPQITQAQVGSVVPLDVQTLTRELGRWMNDAELRAQAAVRARPFAHQHFDWDALAQRWQQHYAQLSVPTS